METFVSVTVSVLGVYLLIGLLFALAFAVKGVQQVDHAAEGTGIGFRLLIIPGTVALWPILLRKWVKHKK